MKEIKYFFYLNCYIIKFPLFDIDVHQLSLQTGFPFARPSHTDYPNNQCYHLLMGDCKN